jgi:hypothetical protein
MTPSKRRSGPTSILGNEVAAKPRHHEATSPITDLDIVHLTAKEAWRIERERERERTWKTPE